MRPSLIGFIVNVHSIKRNIAFIILALFVFWLNCIIIPWLIKENWQRVPIWVFVIGNNLIMNNRKLTVFLLFFFYSGFGIDVEWNSRIVLGTTLSALGVGLNGFVSYKDVYNLDRPGYNTAAFNLKKFGLVMQYGGDWIKYEASRDQVLTIATATTLVLSGLTYYGIKSKMEKKKK